MTGYGHQSVIVFFVLSGFLVGGNSIKQFRVEQFNIKQYTLNRLSRLYVVLVPVLLVTFFLDFFTLNYMSVPWNEINDNSSGHFVKLNEGDYSFSALLLNLFMLQEVFSPVYGSNLPLWSLSYEFWYYVLFPLGCYIFMCNNLRFKVFSFFLLTLIISILPFEILLYFILWLLGVVASLYGYNGSYVNKFMSSFLFITSLLASRLEVFNLDIYYYDFLLSISVVYFICSFNDKNKKIAIYNIFSKKMADFSYTLYLIHFPLMVFLISLVYNLFDFGYFLQPTLFGYAFYFLVVFMLLFLSYLLATITEHKTSYIKQKINFLITYK